MQCRGELTLREPGAHAGSNNVIGGDLIARPMASPLDVANRLQQLLANIALGVPCSQFLFTSWHDPFPPLSCQSWPHLSLRAFQHATSRPSIRPCGGARPIRPKSASILSPVIYCAVCHFMYITIIYSDDGSLGSHRFRMERR